MSSIGEFREGEIDGKPFHLFTFSSQTELSTFSSSGDVLIESSDDINLPLQPLFICPILRITAHFLKHKNDLHLDVLPLDISPHFSNVRSANQLLDSANHDNICKLPVSPLFWCNNKEPDDNNFFCGSCGYNYIGIDYYLCVTCDRMFHKECVESPLFIKSPSYSSFSFQLSTVSSSFNGRCICCNLHILSLAYHLPTHNVSMHPVCVMKAIPIVIDHPKRHPHPLFFFPKQASLTCDVCGLIKEFTPTYICVGCVYVVHQDCIYFPKVIRISRHHHRISFTSSLPSGKWSCGVCRKKVDNNCGAYCCSKCDGYFVHSRCAIRKDLWDGEDLEEVPEEPEEVVEPFERIADGIILHFSHGHHLQLKVFRVYDADKFCQACILPVYEGCYYSCMDQCNFILHEACANAPLKKLHALHRHPLTLKVTYKLDKNEIYACVVCMRFNGGFIYECTICRLLLDVRCASVYEPFEYRGHEHPLYLALTPEEEQSAICQICQNTSTYARCQKLNCIECDYIICFWCATLPYKARYEHDKHLLTFRKEKEASNQSDWCDVCETKVVYSREGGYYSCDDCCTTLHVRCLLGKDMYLKPGETIEAPWKKPVYTLRNNTMSRPFCHGCKLRCPDKLIFKRDSMTFCSLKCSG